MSGVPVLISAGPTWEAWDAIRIITNRSTGAMGYAIAEAFRDAGAHVTLVSGPVARPVPRGVRVVRVESARQMLAAMLRESRQARIIIGTAAVVDYRPAHVSSGKMKKTRGPISLRLVRNPDILASLGRRRYPRRGGLHGRPILVGFALETSRVLARARAKLRAKHLDYIIANRPWLSRRRIGGATDRRGFQPRLRNTVWLLGGAKSPAYPFRRGTIRRGTIECWRSVTRREIGRRLVGRLRADVSKNTSPISLTR